MANLTKRDLVLSISEKSTLTQQEIFTVIQLTLDGITLGSDAALRAFVPLFLSVVLGLVVAAIVWLRERKRRGFAAK